MAELWGEIPLTGDAASSIPQQELELITKPRPIDVEGPLLHQPSSTQHPSTSESHPAEAFSIDSMTVHTIKLIQYARKIRSMLFLAQHQIEAARGEERDLPHLDAAPAIPEYSGPPLKHTLSKPVPFLSKDVENEFVRGIGKAPPEIDSRTSRKLLRKSVAAVCAHAGFDVCNESILETLTDVTHEYLLQFTKLMRHARDEEAMRGTTGFPDVMERVFHEVGEGSMLGLHDFYQERILRYHSRLLSACQLLREEYERFRTSDHKESVKIKIRPEQLADIPFHLMEENKDSDYIVPLDVASTYYETSSFDSSQLMDDESIGWNYDNRGTEAFDVSRSDASGMPSTPVADSDSVLDSGSDIMSPPMRVPGKPPPMKKKKT